MSFGGLPGNMKGLMQQAQKMQQNLQKAKEESEAAVAEGSAGGGAVRVTLTGKYKVEKVVINPEVVSKEEVDLLQDLIKVAFNDAADKIAAIQREYLTKATGGMNIPGLF